MEHEELTTDPQPAPPPKRRKRWWIVGGLLALPLLVYLIGPRLAAPFVRAKLQAMISRELNASLTMDDLAYDFPYGVRARNAALVAKDNAGNNVDLIRVKRLQLSLVKIPWGDGPLLIEKVIIDQPSVNLIFDEKGLVGSKEIVKEKKKDEGGPAAAVGGTQRPSDYFRLRRFEIKHGQVLYHNRARPGARNEPPVTWKDINVAIDITPENAAVYRYEVAARNDPIMTAEVRGKVDIDERKLDVEKYNVAVKAQKGAKYEGLPPVVRKALESNEIDGALTISGKAFVPLKDPFASTHETLIDLPNGRARLSDLEGSLDQLALRVRISNQITPADREGLDAPALQGKLAPTTRPVPVPPVSVVLENFRIDSGGTSLHVRQGRGVADPDTGFWRIKDVDANLDVSHDRRSLPREIQSVLNHLNVSGKLRLTAAVHGPLVRSDASKRLIDLIDYEAIAYPRGVTIQPPKFPMPITQVTGTVRATKTAIVLQNVEGAYGSDRYYVASARIPLNDVRNLDREFPVEEISATMMLRGETENYPRPIHFVARHFHPAGEWTLSGRFTIFRDQLGSEFDYLFDIRSDKAFGGITRKRIPIENAYVRLMVSPRAVEIQRIDGQCLGGRAVFEGVVEPGKPVGYDVRSWLRGIDVKALATVLSEGKPPPERVSGLGSVNVRVWGRGKHMGIPAADLVQAEGKIEVIKGEFWDAPVMQDVVKGVRTGDGDSLGTGDASGEFKIHDRRVFLTRTAVSSPVLGVQGDGSIGFDGSLQLKVVAAPLADWKDQMKRTKIPIVSDVAGEVLGAFQALINAASKTLLYEFRVSGTVKEPKMETVPAPVLTDGVAMLFNSMLKGKRVGDPLEETPQTRPRK